MCQGIESRYNGSNHFLQLNVRSFRLRPSLQCLAISWKRCVSCLMYYLIPLDPNVERRLKPFHKRVLKLVWDIVYSKKTNLVEKIVIILNRAQKKGLSWKTKKPSQGVSSHPNWRWAGQQHDNFKRSNWWPKVQKIFLINVNKSVYYTLDEP